MADAYLTDFEKMMIEFIDAGKVQQYSDEESFKIFNEMLRETDVFGKWNVIVAQHVWLMAAL